MRNTIATTYRAGTIKRDRRTRERVEQLDRQILAVLAEDHPQSVRHVFYRMTDPRLPARALEVAKAAEESERAFLGRLADAMTSVQR